MKPLILSQEQFKQLREEAEAEHHLVWDGGDWLLCSQADCNWRYLAQNVTPWTDQAEQRVFENLHFMAEILPQKLHIARETMTRAALRDLMEKHVYTEVASGYGTGWDSTCAAEGCGFRSEGINPPAFTLHLVELLLPGLLEQLPDYMP